MVYRALIWSPEFGVLLKKGKQKKKVYPGPIFYRTNGKGRSTRDEKDEIHTKKKDYPGPIIIL